MKSAVSIAADGAGERPDLASLRVPSLILRPFAQYLRELETLARRAIAPGSPVDKDPSVRAVLNGQPNLKLRALVPANVRRSIGAFFTGGKLAGRLTRPYSRFDSRRMRIIDPACGAGDLLIACAQKLRTGRTLAETLESWGQQLYGFDLHSEFVRAAKIRLCLTAASRHTPEQLERITSFEGLFPGITVADGLAGSIADIGATHVVLNPPYHKRQILKNCQWATGSVSSAAVFLDACLQGTNPGTQISAILPDVLRTGSFYAKWRSHIEASARIEAVTTYGAFDSFTDADVFILRLIARGTVSQHRASWWRSATAGYRERMDDKCEIHVGPVVPHRNSGLGPWRPYLCARTLPKWKKFCADRAPKKRYAGRTFAPPFVVVRRTSTPRDKKRAVATVITGTAEVAVENHLLVVKPRRRSLIECNSVMRIMRAARTDEWLNKRIRCRHLTVKALRELPWWSRP
jgi:hypothetical protein